jgi:hypothetical protein
MGIRTTYEAVAKLIEIDSTVTTDAAEFIETASVIVDEVCATAKKTDGSDYYSAARLELIERWLAAHFYAIRDPRAVMEKAGPVSQTIESKIDLYFSVTRYGQQAMLIDTNGGLARLNAKMKNGQPSLQFFWAGTETDTD